MREIQNDLLFSYSLIYLLNGLIDVPGVRGFYFSLRIALKGIYCEQEFH